MVGTARFELATSRTPSVRATRLRYVPTEKVASAGRGAEAPIFLWGCIKSELKLCPLWPIRDCTYTKRLSPAFEKRQESMERVAQIEEHFAA